jgi:hypothetical protein
VQIQRNVTQVCAHHRDIDRFELIWSFHDRVTGDWHQGEFWEMEVQQEKSRKKGKSSRKRKRRNLPESLRGKLAIANAPKSNEGREG